MELTLTRAIIDDLVTYVAEKDDMRFKLRTPTRTTDRGPSIDLRVMISHPDHSKWSCGSRRHLVVVKPVSSKHHMLCSHDGWYRDENNRLVARFDVNGVKQIISAGVHTRHIKYGRMYKVASDAWLERRNDGSLYVAGLSKLADFHMPQNFQQ